MTNPCLGGAFSGPVQCHIDFTTGSVIHSSVCAHGAGFGGEQQQQQQCQASGPTCVSGELRSGPSEFRHVSRATPAPWQLVSQA